MTNDFKQTAKDYNLIMVVLFIFSCVIVAITMLYSNNILNWKLVIPETFDLFGSVLTGAILGGFVFDGVKLKTDSSGEVYSGKNYRVWISNISLFMYYFVVIALTDYELMEKLIICSVTGIIYLGVWTFSHMFKSRKEKLKYA